MYGVPYAITPELFPTEDRGTGNPIVAAANRIFGIMAPQRCAVCRPRHLYPDLRFRSIVHRFWGHRPSLAFRA